MVLILLCYNGKETCYLFQITISNTHSILNIAVKKFLDWVSQLFDQWKNEQNFVGTKGVVLKIGAVDIPQYVISLDM